MDRRAALLFVGTFAAACGPSPAYDPPRLTPTDPRCSHGATIHVSARALQNRTGRPDAEVARYVQAALQKHLAGRSDAVLSNGEHVQDRCELDASFVLDPFERAPGKVVIHGTATVVAGGTRATRGSIDKKLTAEVGADDTKATEDLLLVKAIDVLVGALAANVRAMAEGDVEAVQAPPR